MARRTDLKDAGAVSRNPRPIAAPPKGGSPRSHGSRRPLSSPLAIAFLVALAGCAVPVATGLDEGDANRVLVALDHAGIDAAKEIDPTAEGRFRVSVPRDDAARALSAMADEQLPRPKVRGLLDAADRGQLVPSQAAEHAQLVAGLAGELERTLGSVEGVLAARVHMNLPPRDSLRDGPPARSSASVLVEHRGSTPPLAGEAIQRLVAGGAPGLAPADVAVVFVAHTARTSAARADVAHVGPIAVARGSMTLLKTSLVGLTLLVVGLAAAILALYARLARVRREHDALALAPRSGMPGLGQPGGPGSRPPQPLGPLP